MRSYPSRSSFALCARDPPRRSCARCCSPSLGIVRARPPIDHERGTANGTPTGTGARSHRIVRFPIERERPSGSIPKGASYRPLVLLWERPGVRTWSADRPTDSSRTRARADASFRFHRSRARVPSFPSEGRDPLAASAQILEARLVRGGTSFASSERRFGCPTAGNRAHDDSLDGKDGRTSSMLEFLLGRW